MFIFSRGEDGKTKYTPYMKLETQIVTGECPECNTLTMLVSFDTNLYRCVNCGHDLEQKVNGVIKYIIS